MSDKGKWVKCSERMPTWSLLYTVICGGEVETNWFSQVSGWGLRGTPDTWYDGDILKDTGYNHD